MSRKDSKGLFANVLGHLGDNPATPPAAAKPIASPHLMKVAAGVRQIQERGEMAERLLKDGAQVVELDAERILPSAIPDRFDGAYDEAAIAELTDSMRERGQIVPGLVRPVANDPGRYQIVFGRRRLAAARQLGVKFKAIVRELSDEEAIIYQGEENSARNDLSFIEKCAFALSQEQAGFSRATICASLSTGKSHVSEMVRVASSLPGRLLRGIGPAPEVGRRRWLELIEKWNAHPHSHDMVQVVLEAAPKDMASEERFALALSSMFAKPIGTAPKQAGPTEIVSKGIKIAEVSYGRSGGARMNFGKAVPADFVAYLAGQMEAIHDAYLKSVRMKGK